MAFAHLLIYIAAFGLVWLGSGFIVSAVARFSRKLKLSSFAISFVILGLLTSTPEFAVGLTAVSNHDPEIFVGNLLGGVVVIFLFVIPVLAILGNGINLKHDLDGKSMLATLGVILAPALLVLDRRISNPEGVVLIILYFVLLLLVQRNRGIFDRENSEVLNLKAYSYKDMLKLLFGVGLVFISSKLIVDQTLYFSEFFGISAFLISLLLLSIGTNLPELSLAVRSVITGKRDIAFGNYMGSAAANTLFFGIFTLLNHGEVVTESRFAGTFVFILAGLVLFYLFSRSKNNISRIEGIILLLVYIGFLGFEILFK